MGTISVLFNSLIGGRSGFLASWNTSCFYYQSWSTILQLKAEIVISFLLWLNLSSPVIIDWAAFSLNTLHLSLSLAAFPCVCYSYSSNYRDGNRDLEKLNPELTGNKWQNSQGTMYNGFEIQTLSSYFQYLYINNTSGYCLFSFYCTNIAPGSLLYPEFLSGFYWGCVNIQKKSEWLWLYQKNHHLYNLIFLWLVGQDENIYCMT